MSSKQQQEFLKKSVKNIVIEQLLTSEPASLNFDTLLKGIRCQLKNYSRDELSSILDDMYADHELLKLIDAECGVRFKLISQKDVVVDQEDD